MAAKQKVLTLLSTEKGLHHGQDDFIHHQQGA